MTSSPAIRALACIVPLFIASTLGAQQTVPSDLGTRIDHIFDRFTRTTPGCGVGLAKDGRTLYTHGYGSSNLEYDVPNSENTVFESGSVAKQFTASAMLMLVADGKLSLDDDIHKYLPEVPSFGGQRITIRNLLTHTSGLRDQWGLLGIEGRGPGTQVHSPLTTLDLVVHQKMLNFPPGSDYLYSNTGYALAALIVERVSGKTLQEFTQERLFKPLGMTHTQLRDDFTRVVPNRATAYSGAEATGFHQDMPFTNMIGNGGVLSTMGDLMKWNENLDHPTVGGPKYVEAIETQMRLTTAGCSRTPWGSRSWTTRASVKLGTADRRRAIGRFLRAIPTSTCRRPFGATRRTRIPRRCSIRWSISSWSSRRVSHSSRPSRRT